MTLEQLAKERGVRRSDGITPCVLPSVATKTLTDGTHAVTSLIRRAAEAAADDSQCIIKPFGGGGISTASFAMYTFSAAVLVQALVLISFSSVADYGTYRKRLLLGFGFTGSLACSLFIVVFPSIYLLGPLLVVVGVVCLGSSFVLLNSFLPLLASNHMSIRDYEGAESAGGPLSAGSAAHSKSTSSVLALSTQISAKGVGLGYVGAVLMQLVSIGLLLGLNKYASSTAVSTRLRVILFFVGLVWMLGTIPCALWLRDRPGPPLEGSKGQHSTIGRVAVYVTFAWKAVWKTVKIAAQLRQLAIFLVAWFLLSDAIATVSGTAILFARTELKMDTVPIAILSITATTSGIAGAFLWPLIAKRFGMRPHRTIVACVILMEIIPIYGLIGYLPFIKAWGVGGLQQAWEIYPLGVVHGFVMGGLSSYCRSFYGQLIPPGSEAAFYALYAITDKGSSAVGPAVVGIIVDTVCSIRPAFGFLAVLIALPVPLILSLDPDKGRDDAKNMALVLSGKTYDASDAFALDEADDDAAEGLLPHGH